MRRIAGPFLIALLAVLLVPPVAGAGPRTVEVQLLGINDFHGHLSITDVAFSRGGAP